MSIESLRLAFKKKIGNNLRRQCLVLAADQKVIDRCYHLTTSQLLSVCLSVYPSVSMSRCDDRCPSDRTAVHLSHTLHRQHIQVQVGKNVDRLTTWICDQKQRSGVKRKILTMNDDVVVLMIVVKRH